MSIQQDINTFLERTGWSAYRLAKASGVNINIIRRIQRGIRAGMNTRTLDRLAPFIYTSPATPNTPTGFEAETHRTGRCPSHFGSGHCGTYHPPDALAPPRTAGPRLPASGTSRRGTPASVSGDPHGSGCGRATRGRAG